MHSFDGTSSRDPASCETWLGNSTFSFDALSLQWKIYPCPGCQAPGLASATLTACVQGQGGSASHYAPGLTGLVCSTAGSTSQSTGRGRAPSSWRLEGCTCGNHHVLHIQALSTRSRCPLPASNHQYPQDYPQGISDLNTLFWT